ncbi:hypothetical protein KKH27_06365 [bacterium]|nr:hypothetical protein [bacterium]MBU1984973.1 hypothetical protein [bacterium]
MTSAHAILENKIRQIFEDEGVVLLDLTVSGHGSRQILRAIGDRRQGSLTIDDCVRLSRDIQRIIAEFRLIAGDYRLEVTSPGLDYPLREEWQFAKNLGRLLKINLPGERGPREVSGRLTAADADGITLTVDGKEVRPRYAELLSVRILPEFKSPRMESKE